MTIRNLLLSVFTCKGNLIRCSRHALPPTVHQTTIQARVIRKLMAEGWIDARTVLHMGTTDAHKMFTRLRRIGVLFDANDPNGHKLVPNHSGQSCFRRHKWTGHVPAGFDRRKVKRGARA